MIVLMWGLVVCAALLDVPARAFSVVGRARTAASARCGLQTTCLAAESDIAGAATGPATANAQARDSVRRSLGLLSQAALLLSPWAVPAAARAASGAVPKSSVEEARAAAQSIVAMKNKVAEMEVLAEKGEWESVGSLIEDKIFSDFDKTASVLVRSDKITAEDKTALGTIKRYGLVADAIIMIGGLKAVLKAGGVKAVKAEAGGYADQKAIEETDGDDDDDEEEEDTAGKGKSVDRAEAFKFIKLVKGAIEDVNKITQALLR